MANPFKSKAKTTDHIQFWVDETFKEAAEKFEDTPVGAFVLLFVRTKNGNVAAIYRKAFVAPENNKGLLDRDVLLGLVEETFNIQYNRKNKPRKK